MQPLPFRKGEGLRYWAAFDASRNGHEYFNRPGPTRTEQAAKKRGKSAASAELRVMMRTGKAK